MFKPIAKLKVGDTAIIRNCKEINSVYRGALIKIIKTSTRDEDFEIEVLSPMSLKGAHGWLERNHLFKPQEQ